MVAGQKWYAHHEVDKTITIGDLDDRARIRRALEKLFLDPYLDAALEKIQLENSQFSKREVTKVLLMALDVTLGPNARVTTEEQLKINYQYIEALKRMAGRTRNNELLDQGLRRRLEMFDSAGRLVVKR